MRKLKLCFVKFVIYYISYNIIQFSNDVLQLCSNHAPGLQILAHLEKDNASYLLVLQLLFLLLYFCTETEILALFNQPKTLQTSSQYYTVTVPVRIINNGKSICALEASWLEHMTDHFRRGSRLVHGILGLGLINGKNFFFYYLP